MKIYTCSRNLTRNAAEAMLQGGRIRHRAAGRRRSFLMLRFQAHCASLRKIQPDPRN